MVSRIAGQSGRAAEEDPAGEEDPVDRDRRQHRGDGGVAAEQVLVTDPGEAAVDEAAEAQAVVEEAGTPAREEYGAADPHRPDEQPARQAAAPRPRKGAGYGEAGGNMP